MTPHTEHTYFCAACKSHWGAHSPRGDGPCPCCEADAVREIMVSFVHQPIPIRSFDYCAFFDGEEERREYGVGATADVAVNDLIQNFGGE